MPRLCSWVLLALLAAMQLGGSCSEPDAVPLEELQKDLPPPFEYALYCDENGTLVGRRSAVLLVYRAEHLERVYADSQAGNSRAQALFKQLEVTLRATGQGLARQAQGIACGSLPACVVQWHKLDEFMPSRGEGGMRLRQIMAASFSQEARLQQVRNTTTAAVLDVLLVGTVLQRGAAGLPGMKQPLVTDNTGLQLEGRAHPVYVDQLAVDQATLSPGLRPSVHSFSNKQHSFSGKSWDEMRGQLRADSREARTKYGGVVEVRRRDHPLFGQKVRISKVHIVYDGKGLSSEFQGELLKAAPEFGVELHFHVP